MAVAVRSSATAEDLPDASFAGQQETFLNVRGARRRAASRARGVRVAVTTTARSPTACTRASITTQVALSAGMQHMVRCDVGASGVMFTLDTESGFRDVVFITASYGLGETVVQGAVNPDEFYVYKPALRAGHARRSCAARSAPRRSRWSTRRPAPANACATSTYCRRGPRAFLASATTDVHELARQALVIEEHYGCPMDIEWGKDGETGKIYILQARPETVQSRAGRTDRSAITLKASGRRCSPSGRSIGQRIGAGPARVVRDVEEMTRVQTGDVLVADMTDPDWEPVMKRAAAIVTNRGGRTCHAAIIARELGIPAVVGCGDATDDDPRGPAESPCRAPRAIPASSTTALLPFEQHADRARRAAADRRSRS